MEERRRELLRLTTAQSDLGSLYITAERAVQDLQRLKAATGDLLQYVEVPTLT